MHHARWLPKQHRFSSALQLALLDLDELDRINELSSWLSTKSGWAPYHFVQKDYLKENHQHQSLNLSSKEQPLKQRAQQLLFELSGVRSSGRVCLLSQWRFLGSVFNPISLLYFYNDQNQATHLIAEVSNTPWNERHVYWHELEDGPITLRTQAKAFHVSPYNPVDMEYRWRIEHRQQHLGLQLDLFKQGEKHFEAGFRLQKQPMTQRNLHQYMQRQPLASWQTVAGIYWQALKLLCKRIPIYNHQKQTPMEPKSGKH
jgi:uncharacterized protein